MDKEDGEMSDDNSMLVDDGKETRRDAEKECTVFKAEKNAIVIGKLEKVDALRLEERAKRFGLNLTGSRVITQKQIDELYANFGIESGNERHFRFDAINLNGVDGLSTKEIFQYLEDYKPLSLEWVDDISCNVVCQDHISAALALLVHSREIRDESIKDMISLKSNHHWREGVPHPKKDLILMRFATNADKKIPKKKPQQQLDDYYMETVDSVNKNPWGDLCKSWGVYDHQEVFQRKLYHDDDDDDDDEEDEIEIEPEKKLRIKNKNLAMRLGKRKPHSSNKKQEKSEDTDDSDSEWKVKSKVPRMRMHADDEESRQKKKQLLQYTKEMEKDTTFAPLSIEVDNSQRIYSQRSSTKLSDKFKAHNVVKQRSGIQSRLGEKVVTTDDHYASEESSDESDDNTMSRVHKINSTIKSTGNSVWSRLEASSGRTNAGSDLRQKLKSKHQKPPHDLRGRLGKSKHSHLRIEIDNNSKHDL